MAKADRRYALFVQPADTAVAWELEYELALDLQRTLREHAINSYLKRDEGITGPESKVRANKKLALLEPIFCRECHHSARSHPAKRFSTGIPTDEDRSCCLDCYIHCDFEHGDIVMELPLCLKSILDVMLDHMLADAPEPVYVEIAGDYGTSYVSGSSHNRLPIPLSDELEAATIASVVNAGAGRQIATVVRRPEWASEAAALRKQLEEMTADRDHWHQLAMEHGMGEHSTFE